jgi:protein-tyrosine-phosphatase
VAALDLADVELEEWEEVVDPGGGDIDEFTAAAVEIDRLVRSLAPRLL